MTDGDVSLHCEGGEGESRGVHGQELKVDQDRTAQPAPEPLVPQDVVRQDLLRTSHVTSRVRARGSGWGEYFETDNRIMDLDLHKIKKFQQDLCNLITV